MDLDLISPLPVSECQKRLDAALVGRAGELPFWNRPPKKMVGSREGPGFTLQPRSAEMGRYSGYFIQFKGSIVDSNARTVIHGAVEIEKMSPIPPIVFPLALALFAIVWCIHGLNSGSLAVHQGLLGTGLFSLFIAVGIYWQFRSKDILIKFYRRKIEQFLAPIFNAGVAP